MANKNLTAKEAIKNFQEAFGYTPQAIIKILECCMTVDVAGCKECLLKGESNCINKIQTLAHDLIKRQQSEVVKALNEVELLIIITKEMYKQQMEDAPNELSKQSKRTKWVAFEKFHEQFAEFKKKYTEEQ